MTLYLKVGAVRELQFDEELSESHERQVKVFHRVHPEDGEVTDGSELGEGYHGVRVAVTEVKIGQFGTKLADDIQIFRSIGEGK